MVCATWMARPALVLWLTAVLLPGITTRCIVPPPHVAPQAAVAEPAASEPSAPPTSLLHVQRPSGADVQFCRP